MSIQRWKAVQWDKSQWIESLAMPTDDGPYVSYNDHLDAIAEAEARVTHDLMCGPTQPRESCGCRAEGLKAARDAVELRMRVSVYELSDEHKAYNKGIRAALTAINDLREKP